MGLDQWINVKYTDELGIEDEREFYYRKVNFLRQWFIDKGMAPSSNNDIYRITIVDIQALKDDCETVLENPSQAEDILPTTEGFFFGSTEYDEYYFDDVKEVLENANEIIRLYDEYDVFDIFYIDWW